MTTEKTTIDIILISGFLGSGKTTFLNNMLKFYKDKRLGILVNEFGGIPVDGQLIRRENPWLHDKSSIYEIANGSVFCSCRMSEFISGLQYFIQEKPEILFIETSGMSNFSSMTTILYNSQFSNEYNLLYSIVLIDAVKFSALVKTLGVIQKQIVCADYILINKCDLVNKSVLQDIAYHVKQINSSAKIKQTVHGNLDPSEIENSTEENKSIKLESCNTPQNRPGSITIADHDLTMNEMKNFLTAIESYIYRIKGFLILDNDCYYIHDSFDRINMEKAPMESQEKTGLSIICQKDKEKFIKDQWEATKKLKHFIEVKT